MRPLPNFVLPSLHRVGWLGVALWLAAALLLAVAAAEALEAQRRAEHAPDDPSPRYLARAGEIDALLAHFPNADSRERLVADLLDVATASGLEVSAGRYRETTVNGSGLSRIETTLPVGGDRLAVLRWIDALGTSLPTACPTRISLNRADSKEPFSGEVRLDLYRRAAP